MAKLWDYIGAALCTLTGRSNFFFAHIFLCLAFSVIGEEWVLAVLNNTDLIGTLGRLIVRAGCVGLVRFVIIKLELQSGNGDVLPEYYREGLYGRKILTALIAIRAVGLVWHPELQLRDAFVPLLAGSLYLAYQNRPRKDSALKRLLAWTKGRLQGLGQALPQPI